MLSHQTNDVNYDAGREDLKLLFKGTHVYHAVYKTSIPSWFIILWRMQAVQRDLQRNWKLRNVRPHTLRRMLTAYCNW
jgi:hypothetical protein